MRPTGPTNTTQNNASPEGVGGVPGVAKKRQPEPMQPAAAVLAFIFPGLGHWYLGYRSRSVGIAAGVLLLSLTGLFVGGIDSVDRKENPVWFYYYGQMWNGPGIFAIDYVHQKRFKVYDPRGGGFIRSAWPDEARGPDGKAIKIAPGDSGLRPPKIRSIGRITELGTLFIAIGGMLNLIAIIDAAFKHRNKPRA